MQARNTVGTLPVDLCASARLPSVAKRIPSGSLQPRRCWDGPKSGTKVQHLGVGTITAHLEGARRPGFTKPLAKVYLCLTNKYRTVYISPTFATLPMC